MVFMVFSFQHYLSFVERFVENMLSRKCLMFNISFIIFNNSTKIRGVLWLYRYCPWMRDMATSQISCNNGIDKKASHVPL